jgi:osmoprotectant transport system substrate-binding protein
VRTTSRIAAGLLVCLALLAACAGPRTDPPPPPGTGDLLLPVTAQGVACPSGRPGEGRPPVKFGSKDFAEQYTLGELYTQALRSRGYSVTLQSNIGGSEVIDRAFATGQIDAYAEYLGEITSSVAGLPAGPGPEATYAAAQGFEAAERAAVLLRQTPYENTDVIVVRSDFAQRNGLVSLADLARVGQAGDGIVLAGQAPFGTRRTGLPGLREQYGLTGVRFVPMAPDRVYAALDEGRVNAADGFSTDGQLAGGGYTALQDPRRLFGDQFVAPVVRRSVADAQGPEFAQTLDCVSALLTTSVMQDLNKQVQLDGADPAAVAAAFLGRYRVTS